MLLRVRGDGPTQGFAKTCTFRNIFRRSLIVDFQLDSSCYQRRFEIKAALDSSALYESICRGNESMDFDAHKSTPCKDHSQIRGQRTFAPLLNATFKEFCTGGVSPHGGGASSGTNKRRWEATLSDCRSEACSCSWDRGEPWDLLQPNIAWSSEL